MKRAIFFLVSIYTHSCFGRVWNDTLKLSEVVTVYNHQRTEYSDSLSFRSLGHVTTKSIDQLLDREPGFFMKRYGNGMLSSISYRGTNAAQSEIQWNGIPIHSVTTGQNDLSLVNIGSNQSSIHLLKTNRVGAALDIRPVFLEQNGFAFDFSHTFNSMISNTTSFTFLAKAKNIASNTEFLYINSKNRYSFENPFELNQTINLRNSFFQQYSIQHQMLFNTRKNDHLELGLWWNKAERILPNFIPSRRISEIQLDEGFRSFFSYSSVRKKVFFMIQSAVVSDWLQYRNSILKLDSRLSTLSSRSTLQLGSSFLKKSLKINARLNYDYEMANSSGYDRRGQRHIGQLQENLSFFYRQFEANLSLDQVLIKDRFIPAGSLLLSYHHNKNAHRFFYTFSAARTYRLPSLNDLYWSNAGNLNLQPESGWKSDLAVAYKHNFIILKTTLYSQWVRDWILWQPNSFNSNWTPSNINTVLGYGLEAQSILGVFTDNSVYKVFLEGNYYFGRTLDFSRRNSRSKQLIYSPIHKANISLNTAYKGAKLIFEAQHIGSVFTSSDNIDFLPSYWLLNTFLEKSFIIKKQIVNIRVAVVNLLNTTYFSIPLNPLPGRYFEFTINFKFKDVI
jgi:iron complex outermembrane receptor protein